ncbi:MAG: hypothetical protein A2Y14_03365 [Verrucomicrobia bacterium GWF2_51_19]|nr:MAG: hypothetical protein A2Y14_03365 [Verrucomicrobia bacterium GWF2_51_19]HCJ11501.1 anti-sigma factor antagonist [Opitutae bacterium]
MNIKVEEQKGIAIVSPEGRLDANTAEELEESFNELISRSKVYIVVNCKALDYLSSAGLRVFLSTAKQLKKLSGRIALADLNENVHQIFEISGFDSIFSIFDTAEDAVDCIKR